MKSLTRSALMGMLSLLASVTLSYAQTTVEQDPGRTVPQDRMVDEQVPSQRVVPPPDRVVVEERVVERVQRGEVYVAGFGGFTLGHSFSNVEGRGTLANQAIENFDLANSVIYGM